MLWSLYAQWRFRGLDPFEALSGVEAAACPWPGRREAVLTAFALEAAGQERMLSDVADALPGMLGR